MAIISASFEQDVALGLWNLIPLTDVLLRATGSSLLNAPTQLFLRAGDSIHLTTARHAGEREIWTSDRHMLAAAKHFGLTGRSV